VPDEGKEGDVIGVYVDTDKDFMGFVKNGRALGIGFKNFLEEKTIYYFAVTVSTEATVRILPTAILPLCVGDPEKWPYIPFPHDKGPSVLNQRKQAK